LRADRAAIVYLGPDKGLAVAAVHGLAMFRLDDSPISESLLQEVVETNRTIIFNDIKGDFQARGNVSLQLSGAVSVLCVPFYQNESLQPIGALYADTTRRPGAFHRSELLFARDCASWLECCLAGRAHGNGNHRDSNKGDRPSRAW
jgi:GAF domain-containing protein